MLLLGAKVQISLAFCRGLTATTYLCVCTEKLWTWLNVDFVQRFLRAQAFSLTWHMTSTKWVEVKYRFDLKLSFFGAGPSFLTHQRLPNLKFCLWVGLLATCEKLNLNLVVSGLLYALGL